MDLGLILTLIGTILSFYGAYISYKQYIKAKNIANSINDREISMDLRSFLKHELSQFEKTCVSNTINKKGRNPDKFIANLQSVLSALNLLKARILESNGNKELLDDMYNELSSYTIMLKNDNDEYYNKTLESVRKLIAIISNIVNKTVYNAIKP